eukprot:TRINITY_DN33714_c0_g1_i1.p1 TRINITY_DN33714_c0_g1~~TRINITY_DN33714_c0_g1_i1.p1  ORF type:complete len:426 (-),score=88.41 TRINITY_DN33714_c0_g1_i1:152-1429(-)
MSGTSADEESVVESRVQGLDLPQSAANGVPMMVMMMPQSGGFSFPGQHAPRSPLMFPRNGYISPPTSPRGTLAYGPPPYGQPPVYVAPAPSFAPPSFTAMSPQVSYVPPIPAMAPGAMSPPPMGLPPQAMGFSWASIQAPPPGVQAVNVPMPTSYGVPVAPPVPTVPTFPTAQPVPTAPGSPGAPMLLQPAMAPPGAAMTKLAEICACGETFAKDANFCRKCGQKRQQVPLSIEERKQSILAGFPSPSVIADQKSQFSRSLDDQLEAGQQRIAQQSAERRKKIQEAANMRKQQLALQIDQQVRLEEVALEEQTARATMLLKRSALDQRAALEQQAASLTLEYQTRKMQEEFMATQVEMARQFHESHHQLQHEVRRYPPGTVAVPTMVASPSAPRGYMFAPPTAGAVGPVPFAMAPTMVVPVMPQR